MPKNYLFDLDGTIINPKIYAMIYPDILRMIMAKTGLAFAQINEKAYELNLPQNVYGNWDTGELCRHFDLLEDYYHLLEDNIKKDYLLSGKIITLFRKLKSGHKTIGIVSNSMTRTIQIYLEKFQLAEFVDFVFSADDAGCRKSDPGFWQKLISAKNIDPKDSLIIGDDHFEDKELPQSFGFQSRQMKKDFDLGILD